MLFRLALNVSTMRLILLDADAGRIIETIGTFVVGGHYVIGAVVFLVLVIPGTFLPCSRVPLDAAPRAAERGLQLIHPLEQVLFHMHLIPRRNAALFPACKRPRTCWMR
ncbi:MAG: FHIPEP family type III secretion protein [bacterium]|nr:FHIPEP family type III secretion protein [bacterium]